MALEYNAANFTDAFTRLPDYGGYEALAGALGEAYPDAAFSPYNDSYDKGFRYVNMPTLGGIGSPSTGPFAFSPIALQKLAGANIGRGNVYDSIYKAVWPSLTGLVNPPVAMATKPQSTEIEQQNTDILASQPSSSSGVITTTSGGILGETSPLTSPTSTSLTDPMPSQEEVNNIAYKDWVNKTVNVDPAAGGKDIYDLEDKGVSEDVADHNLLANSSVDELIATATSERTPYTSQVPNSANKYLQGGLNAFAYSGEGGYAAERQRMLGRAPDIYQGPKVPWSRLGKAAPSDVYYGNQRFGAPTGEVVDGGGEEFDWNEWRRRELINDIPEGAFHPGNDNWGVNINKHYGDLETAQKEQLMKGAEDFWGDTWGTGLYSDSPEGSVEDFLFYKHPGVNKNLNEGFGKIKGIFSKTGELVTNGKILLEGVIDELTRFTERKGGRGSVTEGEPWGLSAKGLLDILKLDFKELDKQGYGNLQPAAFYLASQHPIFLGLQLGNTLNDFVKDSINVSTYDSSKYDSSDGASFAPAWNNSVEFTASVLRPAIKAVADFVLNDTSDASLKDKVKNAFGLNRVEFDKLSGPFDKDFSDQSSFRIDPNQIPAEPEVDPSVGEIDTSALVDEVLKETVTETGTPPRRGPSPALGTATAPIVNVTIPKEQETTSSHLGQGVSAGSAPSAGSTLSAGPVTGEVKSVTIDDTPPPPTIETDSLGDQSVDITDNNIDPVNISTADLIEMVNPAAETSFTIGPDYTGQGVSAGGGQSAGRYILPDSFTSGGQSTKQIEAQEPPNLPMPSVPLDKDELQARTEQLDKELGEQVRQNISSLLGDGAVKGIYDKWVGKDLTGLGGYFKENNVTNASPMDAALATLSLAQGDMGGMSQEDRMKDFAEKMELAISKLAFKGVDLSNITGIDTATLSYPTDVWNNLALQPNWTSTLSIGDVRPDISITNVQGIQAGNINMDEVWQNMPPEHREALQQQLDLSSGIVPKILSDEFGQLKGDWNFGIPPLLQFGGPDSGVTIDISPILMPDVYGPQPEP